MKIFNHIRQAHTTGPDLSASAHVRLSYMHPSNSVSFVSEEIIKNDSNTKGVPIT